MRCQFLLFAIIQISSLMSGGYVVCAQNLKFDHLNSEHGLSESTILAITQDSEGFMWFGTREGLNRYDARNFKVYRTDPAEPESLSDNFIYSLLTDRSGNLWVGTRNGLNLFDTRTELFRRFYSHSDNNRSLSDNTITGILEDTNGNKWIGTRKGLNLMIEEKDSVSFLRFLHQPGSDNSLVNDDIHSMFEDREGILWIGTSKGFSRLDYKDPHNFSFRSFRLPSLKGKYEKNNSVNTFQEDAYGRLIVGTERNGLIFVNKTNYEFFDVFQNAKLESKAIRSILKDPSGNFWIGTIGGLFIANHNFSTIKNFRNIHDNATSLSDNSIRAIYYDRDGSFWIGTFHGGVNVYSPLAKQFRHLQPRADGQKISVKVASAITSDAEGNFWIATEGNGLLLLDAHSNIVSHFKHEEANANSLSHDNVKCLLLEDKGIWIGTIKGLDFYNFSTRKFTHFRNEPGNRNGLPDDVIYDLRKDGEGRLWIATYFGGLVRFNPDRGLVETVFSHDAGNSRTLSSQTVTRVFLDSRKDLWVGTASGLNRQLPDGSFTRLLVNTETPAYITSIFEDKLNRMWIGTRGTGLYLLTQDGIFRRHFSETDGLPGNSVYAIQEDGNGFLWISTENGLSRFSPEKSHFKNYNRSDGLLCKEFNFNSYHRDHAGYFYFGGYNGVAWFHPDSTYENKMVPAVAFIAVRSFNREIGSNDSHGLMRSHINHENALHFQHRQNIFSVEFAVLNYINSPKNQFAYRLVGFEEEWNYVKEPVATYMNLAPGTYSLQVKGANNDGIWNDTPKTLSIQIFPPPWKTWWAYTGYCITFLLLLFGWARLNRKQMTLKHELELEHLEMVKQEEFHQAKLNFFTNIAHEIRTPLTLIASPIDHILESHSHDLKLRRDLSLVKNNTDRLVRLLNQLLDFQKQETGNVRLKVKNTNIVTFVSEIIDSFQDYSGARKVSLKFQASSPDIYLWFDREELCKVFFNLLANALKFTPGGGEVRISVSTENSSGRIQGPPAPHIVRIIVQDNGLGIPSRQLEKIFHRFYQAENTGIQDAGFGIGLALSNGIIDLHHGTISVESREATSRESGFTKFTIDLRAGKEHFACDEILSEADDCFDLTGEEYFVNSDALQQKEGGEKHLILLVEDNTDIRRHMREMLSGLYEVLESSNGSEGLAIAVERLPDLIVSDVMMPFMNGIELVSKLKTDPRTNHIPVIILTARGTINHQVEGLETGADDYLTKPFHRNILLVKIKNLLSVRESLKEKYSRIVSLQPSHQELENPNDQFLQRLMRILEDNMDKSEFNVSRLVKEIGMSRPVLFRKTKMLTGLSVIDLLRNLRLKKAEMLLKQKRLPISEIAFLVGFSDPKYFSKAFRNQYGKSPSQYIEELG